MSAADLSGPHRFILVRHGQTPHTRAQLLSGSGSSPQPALDATGRAQARAAADRLAEFGRIDEILASPLLRTGQTAALIAARLGHGEVVSDPAWAEAHFGQWEGLTVAQAAQHSPGAWQRVLEDPSLAPPGGESLEQVRRRVVRGWQALAEAHLPAVAVERSFPVVPHRTTVIVTHLTPIRVLICEALAVPHAGFGRIMAAPGSITVVDRWADGGVAVVTLGERPFSGGTG